MKVLDVNKFQQGLERNLNRLTRLESEMKQIETAIQGLTQLEESLKGEGGEALRGFYENCHLPFLEFFNTFKASFTAILQQMDSALTSLEPDASGYISQAYLEGEVEQGLEVASQVTEDLTNETNQIMSEVSDIVSLPNLDDSEVQVGVADAKAHRDDTVEQLNIFDLTQTTALNTIQMDLMLMKTWITNIESMITEGLTDVNFPAEHWKAFAQQNPLTITLAARSMSMDSFIGMDPLLAPGIISGANPYSLSNFQLNGQQPLYNFGINGASVSTNFVSFKKKQEEEIAKELSCPAPDVDEVKKEGNGFLAFLGDIGDGAVKFAGYVGNGAVELGKGALNVGKEVADFIILDDINTVMDPNASGLDKGIAVASIIPVGKVLKGVKLIDNIIDSNVDDVIKKSNVDEVVSKSTSDVVSKTRVVDGKKEYNVNGKWITDKQFSVLRQKAVRQAWKAEKELVEKTGRGTRDWTPDEMEELLSTGKVKGYEGQHMKSANEHPDFAGDPDNIQFLKGRNMEVNEHLDAHGGNYKNPTNGYYDPKSGNMVEFGDEVPWK